MRSVRDGVWTRQVLPMDMVRDAYRSFGSLAALLPMGGTAVTIRGGERAISSL